MDKFSVPDLSVIFSIKLDSADRIWNFKSNLSYLFSEFKDLEVIVIEQGDDSGLVAILEKYKSETIKHVLLKGEVHYKTRNLHLGTNLATRQYVMMLDCDVICPKEALKRAMEKLREGASFVSPYNGVMTEISKNKLRKNAFSSILDNLKFFPRDFDRNLELYQFEDMYPLYGNSDFSSAGGCVLYRKEAYYMIGGWNPNFVSYGYEDMEFIYRIKKLGYSLMDVEEYNIYHMQHQRLEDSLMNNYSETNREEWERITSLNEKDLRRYVLNNFKSIRYIEGKDLVRINNHESFSEFYESDNKISLNGLSIMVPVCIEDDRLLPLLSNFFKYLSTYFRNYEVLLLEADTMNSKYLPNRQFVHYIHVPGGYDIEKMISRGIEEAHYNRICVWDYLTTIEPSVLKSALTKSQGRVLEVEDKKWRMKDMWKLKIGNGLIMFDRSDIAHKEVKRALQFRFSNYQEELIQEEFWNVNVG